MRILLFDYTEYLKTKLDRLAIVYNNILQI